MIVQTSAKCGGADTGGKALASQSVHAALIDRWLTMINQFIPKPVSGEATSLCICVTHKRALGVLGVCCQQARHSTRQYTARPGVCRQCTEGSGVLDYMYC